ncbi:hypothetical protein ASZ90_002963 [hydrocarbon metagenome]|uniref:Uncharacterized protein n=1 Tax=hydrocarbon metagenome TaxID=938273 RepID=A0A0W8G214_9ZZZZ
MDGQGEFPEGIGKGVARRWRQGGVAELFQDPVGHGQAQFLFRMIDGVKKQGVPEPVAHHRGQADVPVPRLVLLPEPGFLHDGVQIVIAGGVGVQIEVHDLAIRQPPGKQRVQEEIGIGEGRVGGPKRPIVQKKEVGQAQGRTSGGQPGQKRVAGQFPPFGLQALVQKKPAPGEIVRKDGLPGIIDHQPYLEVPPERLVSGQQVRQGLALAVGMDQAQALHGRPW